MSAASGAAQMPTKIDGVQFKVVLVIRCAAALGGHFTRVAVRGAGIRAAPGPVRALLSASRFEGRGLGTGATPAIYCDCMKSVPLLAGLTTREVILTESALLTTPGKSHMKTARLVLATLLGFTLAQAAVSGGSTAPPAHKAYVAADVGNSRSRGGFSGSETTEGSTGYDVRAGYQFSRYFALELGYVDLGSFDYEYRPTCIPEAECDVDTHVEMRGPFVNAVGIFPLNDHWQLKARAGFFRLKISSTESGPGAPDVSPRFFNTNSGVSFGIAAAYRLNDNIDLELSWTHFEQVDLGLSVGGDVSAFAEDTSTMTAIGVAYRF
jgi:hypothetical protein